MEKITPGKYVELGYDLYKVNADGSETLMHQTVSDDPERIVFGVTQGMIKPLETALEGLGAGDKFSVTASADEAFGPYLEENVVTLERDIFIVDGKFDAETIAPGRWVPMMTADGFKINGLVKNVTDKDVTLDFNHPLAGSAVRFDGTVFVVREATPEDLRPETGCGHCGCGSCGSEGDGCGDGCGCGDGDNAEGSCCGSCSCDK